MAIQLLAISMAEERQYKAMINILYLHNIAEISGGERSLLNLWFNLDNNKFKPYLVIPNEGDFSKEAKKMGLDILFLKAPKLAFLNSFKILEFLFILSCYIRKNRINIIHSYTPRNNILSIFVGRVLRIPVIWHERNLIFGNEIDISRGLLFLPDRVICNSYAIAERFIKRGKIPSKVRVVINGIDLKEFRPRKLNPEMLRKYDISGRKVVGLISNLGKRKGMEYLLDACPYILKKCPNAIFLIVGGEFSEEDKGRKEELEEKARRLGVGDHVIFTGFLSNVCGIIQVFDIGVAVTEKEACSRAILEIMACGKPVVAYNTGGNPELVEDGITGTLIDFGDVEEFASSVLDLLEDDEKRKKMGRDARERVEKLFDVKINAMKTEEIYSKLIG